MKIQMVDLRGQYEKIKKEVDAGIQAVIDNTQFIKGPQIKQFEEALAAELGVKHVVACANGTDALQIAMMALDLKPGDEVILPVFTYVATAEVIALLGLTPVMVDVDPDTFCIDVNLIEAKITPRTKAIVPVHLFGQCADMGAIMQIASRYSLFVIEDTAQAIGATWSSPLAPLPGGDEPAYAKASAGTIGDIGTTSFFPSKNLGCYGDGGAIFTNDDALAHTIRGIVNHGMYVRYHHDVVGVNSRLDSIQAAVLNTKLFLLDGYNAARQNAARKYSKAFEGHKNIIAPTICDVCDCHVFHQYTLRIIDGDRNGLMDYLLSKGIPCAIYYPIPLHLQKAYIDSRYKEEDFPITNQLVKEVISLPMHTELDDQQIKFITDSVLEFFN